MELLEPRAGLMAPPSDAGHAPHLLVTSPRSPHLTLLLKEAVHALAPHRIPVHSIQEPLLNPSLHNHNFQRRITVDIFA